MESIKSSVDDLPGQGKINYFQKFKKFLKDKFGVSIPEWHSIVVGVGTAIVGGPGLFGGLISFTLGAKKLTGHLKDFRKEIGYGISSFVLVEYVVMPMGQRIPELINLIF